MNKKVILAILDGWGEGRPDAYNAIDNAKTPNVDFFKSNYPWKLLQTDGLNVGLPEGQVGNSEVNHRVIGTGLVIWQDLPKINKAIEDGTFFQNNVLLNAVNHAKQNNSRIHITGILSDGGLHSHINHLFATLKLIKEQNFENEVLVHVFTDGRDTPPKSAIKYLEQLENKIAEIGIGKIATVLGRMYFDRDRDWSKTATAVDLMVKGKGTQYNNWREAIGATYETISNDQYVPPMVVSQNSTVSRDDAMIIFNFRTDRVYQLAKGFLDANIPNLYFTAFCNPSTEFNFEPVFDRNEHSISLAQLISEAGKTQLHITETEKFTHLTYIFNGEQEQPFDKEKWEILESNRYVKPNYNLEPSMQDFRITEKVIETIKENTADFIAINFSNPDMVGHTGNYSAAVIAAESTDFCLGKIYEAIKDRLDEYVLIVTADHGNSDVMWDYDNKQPHTQHTLNPVPFILVSEPRMEMDDNELLTGIAPTILQLMGIEKGHTMTSNSFIK